MKYYKIVQDEEKLKEFIEWLPELFPVDQSNDQLLPIPGTIQGGFVPRFI